MANWMERGCELYGEDSLNAYLHEGLKYKVLTTDRTTAGDVMRFSNRVSNVLTSVLNTKKGDRILVCTSNNLDLAFIIYGIMKTGRVAVPLNFMLKGKEMQYIAQDSGATVFITDREIFQTNIRDKTRMPTIKHWVMAGPESECLEGFLSLDNLLTEVPDKIVPPPQLDKDDLVGIFYTSGTTGFPKGAMVTSRSLLSPQKLAAAILPLRKGDMSVFSLPIAHIMGFAVLFLGAFTGAAGYTMKHCDPLKVLEITEKYRCTCFVGVPTMYALLLQYNPENYDLSSVRFWGSAADAMPPQHIQAFRAFGTFMKIGPWRIPSLFAEIYGMVELSGACTIRPALPRIQFKKGCVGFPIFPTRVAVLDEHGKKVRTGQSGEIAVKGPGVCRGYWNNEEASKGTFTSDGWFRTGDIGRKDRLGLVYFNDRVKDVIKCGGYSIFSIEVEKEMLDCPLVGDVAVFGVPHRTKGQIPIACVVLKPGENGSSEDIAAWCKTNIAAYKVPRDIKIIPPEEMPYTTTLKIMKKKLREKYSEEYAARIQ
jgi:acyl-CoA synthetase (AMP-forming)/AMP-acid ligase II